MNSPPDSPEHSPTSSGGQVSGGNSISTGSSSSQSSVESPMSGGPKYTKVPPPRYRPHQPPLAQRRPLSGGHYGNQNNSSSLHGADQLQSRMNVSHGGHEAVAYNSPSGNTSIPPGINGLKQNQYGKSISAESVMSMEGSKNGGRGGQGQGRSSHDQYQQLNGIKSSSGSSRSSSPQSSNSESQLTPEAPDGRTGSGTTAGGSSTRIGLPQGGGGQIRKSSGLRMWQGQMGHQSRSSNAAPVAPGPSQQRPPSQQPQSNQVGMRKQSSRSPSPGSSGNGRASSQPRTQANQAGSKLRMPSSSNYGNEQQPLMAAYQRGSSLPAAYQASSYGQASPQHAINHVVGSRQHQQQQQQRRPNSLHNSPGPSRPASPRVTASDPQQRRKSSHYPASSTSRSQLGMPPPYGAPSQNRQQPQTVVQNGLTTSTRVSGTTGMIGPPQQQQTQQQANSGSSPVHRNSLSQLHFSNNAKRQLQQPSTQRPQQRPPQQQQQRPQQFTRTYSSETTKHTVGLPAPGFSSRLPMGTSQRSN